MQTTLSSQERVWQSSALLSPTKFLNRVATPIGDDIEPVEESRSDVEIVKRRR